jgi:hypothetical protein
MLSQTRMMMRTTKGKRGAARSEEMDVNEQEKEIYQ